MGAVKWISFQRHAAIEENNLSAHFLLPEEDTQDSKGEMIRIKHIAYVIHDLCLDHGGINPGANLLIHEAGEGRSNYL